MEVHLVILAALVTLQCRSINAREVWQMPRRCCSPDQWEADVRNIGAALRIRDPEMKLSARFAYDYSNKRWAFDYKDSTNRRANRRIVFDHKQDTKTIVTSKGCFTVDLNMPTMDKYCVPVNASYHGSFDYGLNQELIGYDTWSYDMFAIPVRIILRVSQDTCTPLQDGAVTIVRSSWQWQAGEPVCVPWQFPEQAANGECFRSHVAHKVEKTGTVANAGLYNMDFRNINLTISDERIFHIPQNCELVDDWPEHIEWSTLWNFLISRMKMN